MRLALGTVATNRGAIAPVNLGIMYLGKGLSYYADRVRVVTLSDATDTWFNRAGFLDMFSVEPVDGCFFRYSHGLNAGRFQAVCRANNVETVSDTGVEVTAGRWYKREVTVNAAGTSAEFKIDNVVVATLTTNIPIASGRELGFGSATVRTAGTAAVSAIDHDLLECVVDFTTPR